MAKTTETIEPEIASLQTKLVKRIEDNTKIRDDADKLIKSDQELLRALRGAQNGQGDSGYGSKRTNLLAAIDKISKPTFGMSDVETALNALGTPFSKPDLRAGLWTLWKKGEITRVKKGTNSSPAEYAKNSNNGTE
jgi:hypothetical protein